MKSPIGAKNIARRSWTTGHTKKQVQYAIRIQVGTHRCQFWRSGLESSIRFEEPVRLLGSFIRSFVNFCCQQHLGE